MIEFIVIAIVLHSLLIAGFLMHMKTSYEQAETEEQDEPTFRYCEMVMSPDTPMKYRGGSTDDESNSVDFIPMEYRGVLEQDETGTYRYVPLNDVMNEAMDNEDTQETTESITD